MVSSWTRCAAGNPLLLAALVFSAAARPLPPRWDVDMCLPCHRDIVEGYRQTLHSLSSRPAGADSILGSFEEGRNVLRTSAEATWFQMERRPDGLYQVGYESGKTRAERFDVVIGSGRRGQTYLYWRGGLLCQLPVSYWAATGEWVNSPGYPDGKLHFDRLIPARCLECHTTWFRLAGELPNARSPDEYVLGLSCQKCHGGASGHGEIRNPARFSRERKLDACAYCHSGIRVPKKPPFSYRPGEVLSDYLMPEPAADLSAPDVHGNQVALLRASKCFRSSPEMSCVTCHNVHKEERDVAEYSRRCAQCHPAGACRVAVEADLGENCIDCHMPGRKSRLITFNTPGRKLAQFYRTHAIGIYKDAAGEVLKAHGRARR